MIVPQFVFVSLRRPNTINFSDGSGGGGISPMCASSSPLFIFFHFVVALPPTDGLRLPVIRKPTTGSVWRSVLSIVKMVEFNQNSLPVAIQCLQQAEIINKNEDTRKPQRGSKNFFFSSLSFGYFCCRSRPTPNAYTLNVNQPPYDQCVFGVWHSSSNRPTDRIGVTGLNVRSVFCLPARVSVDHR